jgi:ABC-type transporter Mla maintaining outer membrane lipid asymmetry permease subunit MlaE
MVYLGLQDDDPDYAGEYDNYQGYADAGEPVRESAYGAGVGTAATRAVVSCSVLILASDYFLTQLLLVFLAPAA